MMEPIPLALAEQFLCPVCEQEAFWLLPGEAQRCPTCDAWTTFATQEEE